MMNETDLTAEEFDDMIECAVDEALERSFDKKVTASGLVIFLTKYHVNNAAGRAAAFSMLKEMGVKLHSNEGFGCSGRLNTANR